MPPSTVRSLNLDFFAVREDMESLLAFILAETDARIFESYSEFSRELREFRSVDELRAAYPLGEDRHGNAKAILLMLWSPSVMRDLTFRRIALDPKACDGHTFRHRIEGGGLVSLHLGGVCGRVITKSHLGHQSQTRATAWEVDDGVNWAALKALGNQLAYHVKNRLATGKAKGARVLPEAMRLASEGYELKLATQTPWAYVAEPIK